MRKFEDGRMRNSISGFYETEASYFVEETCAADKVQKEFGLVMSSRDLQANPDRAGSELERGHRIQSRQLRPRVDQVRGPKRTVITSAAVCLSRHFFSPSTKRVTPIAANRSNTCLRFCTEQSI